MAAKRQNPVSSLVLQAAHEQETKRSRKPPRRTSEEGVDRSLKENFPSLSSHAIDVFEVEGLTLRQRVLRDKEAGQGNTKKQKLGSSYWHGLREMYAEADKKSEDALAAADKNQPVDPDLRAALEQVASAANVTQKVMSKLLAWLPIAQPCNQRELVGLLKLARTLRPSSDNSMKMLVGIMKYIVRTKLDQKHAKEVNSLQEVWDDTLELLYAKGKKSRQSLSTWWSVWKECCRLALDPTLVQKILDTNSEGSFSDLAVEISAVTAGSKLGERLFGFLHSKVVSDGISRFMCTQIAKLPANGRITMAWLQEITDATKKEVLRLGGEDRRNAEFQ
jgi:hypothetical protein